MHSTEGYTNGIRFSHNGDFSGTLHVHVREDAHWEYGQDPIYEYYPPVPIPPGFDDSEPQRGHHCFRIPFMDIKKIVARYVRNQHIEKLENMSDDEVLSLITIADKVRI